MIIVNEPECEAAGIDPEGVKRLAKLLEKAGKMANELNVCIFGGSGSGSIRAHNQLVLYDILNGHFDGGDGGCMREDDGLLWGECDSGTRRRQP